MGTDRAADRVRELWRQCLPSAIARAETAFEELARRYSEPHRHHHVMKHVEAVTSAILKADPQASETLLLAAILHDVIYDPHADDNEEKSADFARELLTRLDVEPSQRDEVARLILLTRSHEADSTDESGKQLLDADLSILGADAETYDEYAQAIRREYDWVTESDYRSGRRRVLDRFLKRERIYLTSAFYELEVPARANLRREIESLS